MILFMLLAPACILFQSGEIVLTQDSAGRTPSIELIHPQAGQVYPVGSPVPFEAEIIDADNSIDDLTLQWTSSIDGPLNLEGIWQSNVFSADVLLSEGGHRLVLVVEDPSGLSNSTEVEFEVAESNESPLCELTAPVMGSTFSSAEPIQFLGSVSDVESPTDSLSATLTSDKDGLIGNPTLNPDGLFIFESNLASQGEHIISLDVTDEQGAQCKATTTLTIQDVLRARINEPTEGSIFGQDEQILFDGLIENSDLATGELSIEWRSSIDDTLYTGRPDSQGQSLYSPQTLSYGPHEIAFVVYEDDQERSRDTVNITINGLPIIDLIDIIPLNPQPDELFTCVANAFDEDGGSLTLDFVLQNLNSAQIYPPTNVTNTEVTLDLALTNVQAGDRIQCTVTARDELGFMASASVNTIVGDSSIPDDTSAQSR